MLWNRRMTNTDGHGKAEAIAGLAQASFITGSSDDTLAILY